MDLNELRQLAFASGYTPVTERHFFYEIFPEEVGKKKEFFILRRSLFFNVLMIQLPFNINAVKLFEIPRVEIENALKEKFTMPLHIPPDKGYLPNHEGEEVAHVLRWER